MKGGDPCTQGLQLSKEQGEQLHTVQPGASLGSEPNTKCLGLNILEQFL